MGFKSCIISFVIEPMKKKKINFTIKPFNKTKVNSATLTRNRNHLHQIGYIGFPLSYNI
jgi:hypothetical protein